MRNRDTERLKQSRNLNSDLPTCKQWPSSVHNVSGNQSFAGRLQACFQELWPRQHRVSQSVLSWDFLVCRALRERRSPWRQRRSRSDLSRTQSRADAHNSRNYKYQTLVWLPGRDFFSPGGQNVPSGVDSGRGFTTTQLGQGREKAGSPSHLKETDPLKKASGCLRTLPSSLLPGSLPEWRPTPTVHGFVCSSSIR